jgi:hypothetical protein
MKKLMIIVCLLYSLNGISQSQELKQLSLDIEKLAQLKSMLSQMYQGYTILDKGYNNIKDLSEGNFSLHKNFLDGLLTVSPAVRNSKKIVDIITAQASLVKEYKASFSHFKSLNIFQPAELDYLSSVYTNLFNRSVAHLEELALIINEGRLRMNDAERLDAIDRIAASMNEKVTALRQFNKHNESLSQQRVQQKLDTRKLKSLY